MPPDSFGWEISAANLFEYSGRTRLDGGAQRTVGKKGRLDSAGRDVKAGLVDLIFHITCSGQPLVFQHFGQDRFVDSHPTDLAGALLGVLDLEETVVGDVECGAILVAGIGGGIAVVLAKLLHIGLGAEYGCHEQLVQGIAFGGQ